MSLQKIQERLKVPKSNYNNFGKYQYRSVEDIQEALKPLLAEYEYTLIIGDDVVEIGNRIYIKSTARLFDKSGKVIVGNQAFAREPENKKGMDVAQITGATSSYARKYCLGGMFLLDDTRDADSGQPQEPAQPPAQPLRAARLNKYQLATLQATVKGVDVDLKRFLEYFKVDKIEEMAASDYNKAMQMLKLKKQAKQIN